MGILNRLFGATRNVRHPFNREVVLAKLMAYHMQNHLGPGEKLVMQFSNVEYDRGDFAVGFVAFAGADRQGYKFYLFNMVTGEISDDTGELALPTPPPLP